MSSASSKYVGLPDVAFDQPDVYETEDLRIPSVPVEDLSNSDHPSRNLDINNLDIKQAKEFFGLKDSASNEKSELANKYRKALFNSYLLQHLNGDLSVSGSSPSIAQNSANILLEETNSEKLMRLTIEVNQLLSQVDEKETETENNEKDSIFYTLSILQKKLESISNRKLFLPQSVNLSEKSIKNNEYPPEPPSQDSVINDPSPSSSKILPESSLSVTEFERRISNLERIVDPELTSKSSDFAKAPLFKRVEDLQTKVELLTNPKFLESVSKRAKLASEELEHLAKNKEILSALSNSSNSDNQPSSDKFQSAQDVLTRANQEKISTLYEKLPSLEPMAMLIPSLMDRLDNLSKLHTRAASVVESFDSANDLLNLTQKSRVSDLYKVVDTLKSSIESNSSLMIQNVKDLETRMEELMKKIKSSS
ncbi:putative dynactin subunit 2 [Smittium mucronatum]|uniref:Putative dynactin subunit 2 n=1 Tax=Smittium mucronatum TaxID=133383 RepID=A0A1R0GP31_9FUNG|nr:putative dynactin subunit 2 [Smittium mucronatum]OLY78652.1 putative dynactin subunit 2 [Smittium mucronatum]